MIRALSSSRSRRGYNKLAQDQQPLWVGDEEDDVSQIKLRRVTSLPAWKTFGSTKYPKPPQALSPLWEDITPAKSVKKGSKTHHPFLSLFDLRNKKKPTAKPEFARYLEYLREGGVWDANSNQPVMYFK